MAFMVFHSPPWTDMVRQSVAAHKDSGIVNDANDYAVDTVGEMLLIH